MANETRTVSPATKIEAWMNDGRMLDRIGAALSGYLDARTFAAQCVLATKDAKLADCSAESLFEAFLVCAQMGLLPGKHHGHVALIARRDRDRAVAALAVLGGSDPGRHHRRPDQPLPAGPPDGRVRDWAKSAQT